MIQTDQLTEIGKFKNPHGINGEISAIIDDAINLTDLRCIIVPVDGIFVPFFISAIRPRNVQALLLTIDGITNEKQAAIFTDKTIYALSEDCTVQAYANDPDGFYAADLIGFTISDQSIHFTGVIDAINDETENILFIVTTPSGDTVMIPVADEYITDIDTDARTISISLPEGFLEI